MPRGFRRPDRDRRQSDLEETRGRRTSQWHCAVGRIHYEDVDTGATPGTLFYIKPTLTGDEPSDVRNYVVNHPTFPHESTADQFFSESQFESYRVLGEHVAIEVFDAAVCNAGRDPKPASLFSQLRREWFPPPPNLDKNFQGRSGHSSKSTRPSAARKNSSGSARTYTPANLSSP